MRICFVHEGTRGTPFLSTEDTEGRGELQRRLQLPFVHEGPRRNTKNCNGNTFVHGGHGGPRRTATATATSFCPRRATEGHEELQRQHICPRRTRRAAENCNGDCNFFCPRRAAKDCATKNCNGNTFVSLLGGHGGPRRTATATATSFCPRKGPRQEHRRRYCKGTHKGRPYGLSTRGPGEGTHKGREPLRRLQGHPLLSTKGRGGGTHEGAATATHLSTENTEGTHGELQRQHICPRRHPQHGGPRGGGHPQGAQLTVFVHEGATKGAPRLEGACERHPQGAPLFGRREGAHKGNPYGDCNFSRGAPFGRGRAPTRGAPTRFRQPHEVFSNLMQLPWRS